MVTTRVTAGSAPAPNSCDVYGGVTAHRTMDLNGVDFDLALVPKNLKPRAATADRNVKGDQYMPEDARETPEDSEVPVLAAVAPHVNPGTEACAIKNWAN